MPNPLLLTRLAAVAALLAFQQEEPPPEPPASTPACSNTSDNSAKNCHCAQGMLPDGRHDAPPDKALGNKWCSTYCLPGKCKCLSPMKTVMPMGQGMPYKAP